MTDRRKGFTLLELVIVMAVLAILGTMMIPVFLDTMQRAKQRRTMAEIHMVGKAMMGWLTDEVAAAAAGASPVIDLTQFVGPIDAGAVLEPLLVPQYTNEIPSTDGWYHPYEYYLDTETPGAERIMAVRSAGRDRSFSATSYTVGPFATSHYDEDLVWADGYFVRWPQD